MKKAKHSPRKTSKEEFLRESRKVVVNFIALVPSKESSLDSSRTSSSSQGEGNLILSPDGIYTSQEIRDSSDYDALESSVGRRMSEFRAAVDQESVFKSEDLPIVPLGGSRSPTRPNRLKLKNTQQQDHSISSPPRRSSREDGGKVQRRSPMQAGSHKSRLAAKFDGSPSPRHSTPVIETDSVSPPKCSESNAQFPVSPASFRTKSAPTSQDDLSSCLQSDDSRTLSEAHSAQNMDSFNDSNTLSEADTPENSIPVDKAETAELYSSQEASDLDQSESLPSDIGGTTEPSAAPRSHTGTLQHRSSHGKMNPIPEHRPLSTRQISGTSDDSDLSSRVAASRSSRASSRLSVFEISKEDLKQLVEIQALPPTALTLQSALCSELEDEDATREPELMRLTDSDVSEVAPSPASSCRPLSPESEVARQLGHIGDEVQEEYSKSLNTAVSRLSNLPQSEMTVDRLYDVALQSGIVMDRTNDWKQVVLWLVFSQRLAFLLLQKGERKIHRLIDLATKVLEDKMANFILNQGGWASIQDLEPESPVSVSDISPRFPELVAMAEAAVNGPAGSPVINGKGDDEADHVEGSKPTVTKTPPQVPPKPSKPKPPSVSEEGASKDPSPKTQEKPQTPKPDPTPAAPAATHEKEKTQNLINLDKEHSPRPGKEQSPKPTAASPSHAKHQSPLPEPMQPVKSEAAKKAAAATPSTSSPNVAKSSEPEQESSSAKSSDKPVSQPASPPAVPAEEAEQDKGPVDVEKIRPEINMMRQISEQFDEDSEALQQKYSLAKLAVFVGAVTLGAALVVFAIKRRR